MRGQPEVVRDEQQGGAGVALHAADDLHDMRLRADVERRRRLVGDDELRTARERHRDQHALAHAARELKRIAVEQRLRIAQPHLGERRDDARAPFAARNAEPLQMLAELLRDCQRRIERRQRLLRDEGDVATEQGEAVAIADRQKIPPVEMQRAARD